LSDPDSPLGPEEPDDPRIDSDDSDYEEHLPGPKAVATIDGSIVDTLKSVGLGNVYSHREYDTILKERNIAAGKDDDDRDPIDFFQDWICATQWRNDSVLDENGVEQDSLTQYNVEIRSRQSHAYFCLWFLLLGAGSWELGALSNS